MLEWLQIIWRSLRGIGTDASVKISGQASSPNATESGGIDVEPQTKPEITNATADLSDGFFDALAAMGRAQKWDPSLALTVMANESGIRANKQNAGGAPAYGLIQFYGPQYAYVLGLSAEQQMPLVANYYAGHAPYARVGEVYGQTFLPARMAARGRSPDTILTAKGESFYDQNADLDANRDGTITIQDLEDTANAAAKALGKRYTESLARLHYAMAQAGTDGGTDGGASFPWAGVLVVAFGLGWLFTRK